VSFEVAFFLSWPTASFNIARGVAPGAEKHGPILANGQIQFETYGLMLAVGQQTPNAKSATSKRVSKGRPNSHDGPIRGESRMRATVYFSNVPCSDIGHTERSELRQETLFSVASQAP
jgi:hypothetical protein